MKKILFVFWVLALLGLSALAQHNGYIYYQALLRSDGASVTGDVNLQISVLLNDTSTVYTETQTVTPTAYGKVDVFIGSGTKTSDGVDFKDIDWGKGKYSVKVEFDLNQDGTYTVSGTSDLSAVPAAIYAQKSRGVVTLSATEIQALTPSAGEMVYNTDDQVLMIYDGNMWRTVIVQ
jgi:hypothetical protein